MSMLDRLEYEYEWRTIHPKNEWRRLNLESLSNRDFLREYSKGNKFGYEVRVRAVLRSDWEAYVGPV